MFELVQKLEELKDRMYDLAGDTEADYDVKYECIAKLDNIIKSISEKRDV